LVYNKYQNRDVHPAIIEQPGHAFPGGHPTTNTDNYNWYTQVRNNHGGSVAKTVLPAYICPSDILPLTDNNNYGKSNYCACLGSEIPWITYLQSAGGTSWSRPTGQSEQDGVFRLAQTNTQHYVTTFGMIIDGTSNVIAVGEVSATSMVDPKQTGRVFPLWAGGNNDWAGQWRISSWARVTGPNTFINNIYPKWDAALPNGPINNLYPSDFSFGSKHPGGAQFALADGSVKFFSETMGSTIYAYLGAINDGNPVFLP